jgi:UDP-2,3-diacylglucosamine pyrophosphatase LpxH
LDFIRSAQFETIYLVGDIIDIWALRRGIYWPQTHNDVIQKLLRCARKGARVIYIPGNHDEFVGRFCGHYGNIAIQHRAIHTTADGKRLLVIHGHEMDTVIQNLKWLAHVGDLGYKSLMGLNGLVNFFRKRLGMGYWSLSAYVKKEVKNVVSFIGQYEESIVRHAREYGVSGVVCGHIHSPAARTIGDTLYFNSGDWVESCTALVEDWDGTIQILKDENPFSRQKTKAKLESNLSPENEEIVLASEAQSAASTQAMTAERELKPPEPFVKSDAKTRWIKTLSAVSK